MKEKEKIEERRRKNVVCTNLKQTSTKCGVSLCGVQGNAGKNAIPTYKKRRIDKFINVSHVFIYDIGKYMATFCDLMKGAKISFIFQS